MLFTRHTKNNIYKICLVFGVVGIMLFLGVYKADAATMYLKPDTATISSGSTIYLKVFVNTEGAYINSADGTINFPTDLFDVVGVSKTSSMFSVWIEEPSFSNVAGTVTFSGGLPSPGFIGGAGEVLTITLKAKKTGTGLVSFSDGSVRANDGLGTDLLSAKLPTTIKIGAYVAPAPKITVVQKNSVPGLPVFTSINQPKDDQWYKNNQVSFSWTVPTSITLVQVSVNTKAVNIPTVTYDGSVSSKTLNNLEDGVYYFNIRQQNEAGWGLTAHLKIQIDTKPPNVFTPVIHTDDVRRVATIQASTTDEKSGVDHFSASLDGHPDINIGPEIFAKDGYTLPPQSEGQHSIVITAYDGAGNGRSETLMFDGTGAVSPQLITSAQEVQSDGNVVISGTTPYPNIKVRTFVQIGTATPKNYDQITENDGSFKLILNELKQSGTVAVWSSVVFDDSKLGASSEKVYFTVAGSKIIRILTQYFIPILIITLILLLISTLLFMLYLGWHKFFGLRRKFRNDLQETAGGIHKVLVMMKGELTRQLTALEKVKEDRDLNAKEQKIFSDIQNNVDGIDEFIQKKIKKLL